MRAWLVLPSKGDQIACGFAVGQGNFVDAAEEASEDSVHACCLRLDGFGKPLGRLPEILCQVADVLAKAFGRVLPPAIPNLGGIARPLVDAARATAVPGP